MIHACQKSVNPCTSTTSSATPALAPGSHSPTKRVPIFNSYEDSSTSTSISKDFSVFLLESTFDSRAEGHRDVGGRPRSSVVCCVDVVCLRTRLLPTTKKSLKYFTVLRYLNSSNFQTLPNLSYQKLRINSYRLDKNRVFLRRLRQSLNTIFSSSL